METIKGEISINLPSSENAKSIFIALQPETTNALTDRSTISINREKNTIHFNIQAKDITAFRATLNSYLIWTRVLLSISSLVNSEEDSK